jgi:hypothetical protein
MGDINGDGVNDLADLVIPLKLMAKIEVVDVANLQADVDGDGRISLIEAVYALGKLAEEEN